MVSWSLLSNHGLVLQLVNHDPTMTQGRIAEHLDVNLRTVNRIFADLKAANVLIPDSTHRIHGHTINPNARIGRQPLARWLCDTPLQPDLNAPPPACLD